MMWLSLWMATWVVASAPSESSCRVHVEGLPQTQRRHHRVRVGTASQPLDPDPRVAPEDEVVLEGPRFGGRIVVPSSCAAVVPMPVTPRPALLAFAELPPGAVITCEACPGIPSSTNYRPMRLPPIAMTGMHEVIRLRIRARGYESVVREFLIHPGLNALSVPMKQRR
ncbi:MAG: hypothetical protein AAGA54_11285 [Myxococcota bacterium]